jgi:PleD family two-component response regulator
MLLGDSALKRELFLRKCCVTDQNSKRVLLVDDEPGVLKVLRVFLELAGYTVFEAATAS